MEKHFKASAFQKHFKTSASSIVFDWISISSKCNLEGSQVIEIKPYSDSFLYHFLSVRSLANV